MRIALVGATGMIGSKIVAEAAGRGHTVTALCRHPEDVVKHENVRPAFADVMDTAGLARLFGGQEVIVHSYSPPFDTNLRADANAFVAQQTAEGRSMMEAFSRYRPADRASHETDVQARIAAQTAATRSIIEAARAAGVKRICAVGGAGTLLVDGVRTMDRPDFPVAFEGGAKSTAVVKELLRAQPGLDWTVLCPPMLIRPGPRTGKFRLGLDDLLVAADGSSRISVEDFAAAFVDELENPKHTRRRFTVGY
ncbi:MAG TPA: NAD(P)H-binding protein [Bryobacteraceae bacterium]|nr:NAD(P)H-binding protein [Bryobacteraceae bacterium]